MADVDPLAIFPVYRLYELADPTDNLERKSNYGSQSVPFSFERSSEVIQRRKLLVNLRTPRVDFTTCTESRGVERACNVGICCQHMFFVVGYPRT